jgi:hypothetical protein
MERLLEGSSGGDSSGGTGEDGEAAIAFTAWSHHLAMMLRNNLLGEGIVPHERLAHGVAVLLPESGAAFNIGEEEGDGAGREFRHG